MKILLWGYGNIGGKHHNNIKMLYPDIEVGIFDPDKGHNDQVNPVSQWDLIIICTPAKEHLGQMNYLNMCGAKYIMVEKPLCVLPTPYQIAERVGSSVPYRPIVSQIFVNHAYRFERGILKLKELSQTIGKIDHVFMENWYSFDKMHKGWDKSKFEGVIYDDSHIINASRFLWGEPLAITFKDIRKFKAMWNWTTDRGIEVNHVTIETSSRYKKRIEVVGEKGNLIWNFKAHEIFFAPADETERVAIPYKHADHLAEALKYAITCVQNNEPFKENTLEDSIKDMDCIGVLLK